MNNLTILFENYIEQKLVIELQDRNHRPVAALYPDQMNYKHILVSETNNDEKYYIIIDGIAIFFTYYRKLTDYNII